MGQTGLSLSLDSQLLQVPRRLCMPCLSSSRCQGMACPGLGLVVDDNPPLLIQFYSLSTDVTLSICVSFNSANFCFFKCTALSPRRLHADKF